MFTPINNHRISLCFSYLAYSGEQIEGRESLEELDILHIINETMPEIGILCNNSGQTDWKIVWGPAVYTFSHTFLQDNLMFVAQQISQSNNYVVAIRGTNGLAIWDWIEEDFRVWRKVDWQYPQSKKLNGTPKISEATKVGVEVLLDKLIPKINLPGENQSLRDFLTSIAQNQSVVINFTGHSLAGALSPTLALWFKQYQSLDGHWDPSGNALITTTSFAGATAGNQAFSDYFDSELGSSCSRIYNSLDIVPHAWEMETLRTMPDLYSSAGIQMNIAERALLEFVKCTVKDYKQIETSMEFSWNIQLEWLGQPKNTFIKQVRIRVASAPVASTSAPPERSVHWIP